MTHTAVITRKGATPEKILQFVREYPNMVKRYRVIILRVGTNWLGTREEWRLYLRMVNSQITEKEYEAQIWSMNPPSAKGEPEIFRQIYQNLIDLIRQLNPEAKILISSIIPRLWDHARRNEVRMSYNAILQNFSKQDKVYFIRSYKPFFDKSRNLKCWLFNQDGLHLSNEGAVVLRTCFCDRIDKALKGLLK